MYLNINKHILNSKLFLQECQKKEQIIQGTNFEPTTDSKV